MYFIKNSKVIFGEFSNLSKENNLLHFSSIRNGGVSSGAYKSLNLGYNTNDEPDNVTENRGILASSLGISISQFIFPQQSHGSRVARIDHGYRNPDLNNTDALVSSSENICLCIQTADCVPVLLYDPRLRVIAVAHAGWRSTVAGIVEKTIQEMRLCYNSRPEDIIASLGPSISGTVYEVGTEVLNALEAYPVDLMDSIRKKANGKAYVDLRVANKLQLISAGLLEENIEASTLCTYSEPELFFSSRRDGGITGRMATGIMLKPQ